jgi:hypothetical protein
MKEHDNDYFCREYQYFKQDNYCGLHIFAKEKY